MTMNDICREVNCKYVTWSNGGGDSTTAWLECKLHNNKATDESHCVKCKDRIPKRSDNIGKR